MSKLISIADLFRASSTTEEFRKKMHALRGSFSLSSDDIIELGKAYLERFPGCDGNEECDDVRDAYEVAKICTIEYLLAGIDENAVSFLRKGFANIQEIASLTDKFKSTIGPKAFVSLLVSLNARAETLHDIIKTLPASIIKERFSGALAYVTNVLYLLGIEAGLS